ncbi:MULTISPECIES: TRAP transporter substrate-binding protein DctP [Hydrogenophaga]|uniref:C4-dicarboxylate ABC transporter n=1 Tax=Hydrogenophaga electricum TaxID=1230953 RepID=A0ABQ6C396_9BURK|nr:MULTISPECIES: TRAP transporter substrate-binding protein DctP [Hydrogenophaga]GLS14818.1 C4-dicarboxylate ABC transporter [Hydrogenophaga electricum]
MFNRSLRKPRLSSLVLAAAGAAMAGSAAAADLTISAGLPKVHFWVGQYMEPFANAVEAATPIRFKRFYAGELVAVGRELDALKGGTIDVAAPLLAPYHEGRFALSDVTQLPTYNTSAVSVTKAFQKLLDSPVKIKGDKSFYQYEIADKGIRVWPLGATAPYVISTTGKVLQSPAELKGLPLRAGSAMHTIVLQQLGATPVTMPASQAYEALSRGTVNGLVLSVADWKSYSFQDLIKYTVTGVSIGHWESYLATTEDQWNKLPADQRQTWDRIARETALKNAEGIDRQDVEVREAAEKKGSKFVPITSLSADMQTFIAKASANTWIQWIEQTEKKGQPGKATAKLWASLVQAEGGKVPDGVAEYLAK